MVTELEEMDKRHREEMESFIIACPHNDVLVEDVTVGFRRRDITLRCSRCRLNLLTYCIDNGLSYLSYVRDCVKGHPGSRK